MITTENVATYDYIVVGAGSAGAHDENVPEVLTLTRWMELLESGYDWDYPIEAQGNGNVDMNTVRHGYPTADNAFCLTPNVTHARSRGTVRLRTRDYRDKPRVDPRYVTDPEGYDLRIMTAGIRKAREIVSQSGLCEWSGEELFPGQDVQTVEEMPNTSSAPTTPCTTLLVPAGWVRSRIRSRRGADYPGSKVARALGAE